MVNSSMVFKRYPQPYPLGSIQLSMFDTWEKTELYIIESVDSISRDGPDTPIYAIHYKKPKNSDQFDFSVF